MMWVYNVHESKIKLLHNFKVHNYMGFLLHACMQMLNTCMTLYYQVLEPKN